MIEEIQRGKTLLPSVLLSLNRLWWNEVFQHLNEISYLDILEDSFVFRISYNVIHSFRGQSNINFHTQVAQRTFGYTYLQGFNFTLPSQKKKIIRPHKTIKHHKLYNVHHMWWSRLWRSDLFEQIYNTNNYAHSHDSWSWLRITTDHVTSFQLILVQYYT